MRAAHHLLPALLLVPALAALVRPPAPAPEELEARTLHEMLTLVADASEAPATSGAPRPLWRVLLDSPAATHDAHGTTLVLGRVLADPSRARASAECAGELLRLGARSDSSAPGQPLWRVLLDGPASEQSGAERVVKLNGCVHRADADAGPVLEDTYAARLALAHSLRALASQDPEADTLVILGEDAPVKGGANFALRLEGETQSLELTFDGQPGQRFAVERTVQLGAPNDGAARQSFVAGLEALAAADGSFGPLTITGRETPANGGLDLRLERFGERQELHVSLRGVPLLSVHRPRSAQTAWQELRVTPLIWVAAALGLWLALLLARRKRTAPAFRTGCALDSDTGTMPSV